jgi:hypothetical protein
VAPGIAGAMGTTLVCTVLSLFFTGFRKGGSGSVTVGLIMSLWVSSVNLGMIKTFGFSPDVQWWDKAAEGLNQAYSTSFNSGSGILQGSVHQLPFLSFQNIISEFYYILHSSEGLVLS